MRKLLIHRPVIGALLAALTWLPKTGYAQTVIFQDNFENEQPWNITKWTVNPDNNLNPRSTIVNDNSNYAGAPSGSHAAQVVYTAGNMDGGGVGWLRICCNVKFNALPDHFKLEFDFKLSSNFHFPLGQKFWRAMPDMNSGQLGNDTILNNQLNQYGTMWEIDVESNSSILGYKEANLRASLPSPVTTNVWHRIGFRYKKNSFTNGVPNNDGEIEIFYDGVSLGSRTDVRMVADPTRPIRDYWGGPGNYTSSVDNNPIPADQWIRVDNFQVTDLTRTGSSPPPPPMIVQ